jgi:hypothetical protein
MTRFNGCNSDGNFEEVDGMKPTKYELYQLAKHYYRMELVQLWNNTRIPNESLDFEFNFPRLEIIETILGKYEMKAIRAEVEAVLMKMNNITPEEWYVVMWGTEEEKAEYRRSGKNRPIYSQVL